MMACDAQRHGRPLEDASGHSLAELLAVMSIMAIVLLLLLPTSAPARQPAVQVAVNEIAEALRFAQADAIRSGSYRVVAFDTVNHRVRVYALNMAPKPPVEDVANPVRHPIDKNAYSVTFPELAWTRDITIDSTSFNFTDNKPVAQITFKWDGTPVKVLGPNDPDIKALVGPGVVTVSSGSFKRTVSVDPDTGRVTQQS